MPGASKSRVKDIISWESLRRLHKISNNSANSANEIEELLIEAGTVSEFLQSRQGVTIWKFRDCCDEICRINSELHQIAREFQDYLEEKPFNDNGLNI